MNENEIKSLRQKIRMVTNQFQQNKPFALGMYSFTMFMINYYSRVQEKLKINYDSFMIIQTVVSHALYQLNKKNVGSKSYSELEEEWEKLIVNKNNIKLTVSSICLLLELPKETVRRKVLHLCKKNLLKRTIKDGIFLGPMYKKVFKEFVPQTTQELSKLIRNWEETGILKSILSLKI